MTDQEKTKVTNQEQAGFEEGQELNTEGGQPSSFIVSVATIEDHDQMLVINGVSSYNVSEAFLTFTHEKGASFFPVANVLHFSIEPVFEEDKEREVIHLAH